MGIEEFAARWGLSVRTLRYYMDLHLLHPKKEGRRLCFDESCVREMETILKLKACGLTLPELQQWSDASREQKLTLLREKLALTGKAKTDLQKQLRLVDDHIETLACTTQQSAHGSAVAMLRYVCCPKCGSNLEYTGVHIRDNCILEGSGSCDCGYTLKIEDGILISQWADPQMPVITPLDRHWETYNRIQPDEVSALQINYNWICRRLKEGNLSGKVLFENSVDVISFLRTGIGELAPEARYIIADSDFHVLQDLKHRIDALGVSPTILYLVSPTLHFPLRPGCIDLAIDYYTTEILQRFGIPTMVQGIRPYLSDRAKVLGVFTYIKKGSGTFRNNARRYPDSYPGRYRLRALQENLLHSGVRLLEDVTSNILSSTTSLDTYEPGDVVGEYCFCGTLADTREP